MGIKVFTFQEKKKTKKRVSLNNNSLTLIMQFAENTGHRNSNMQHNSNSTHRNIMYGSLNLAQGNREHLKQINIF